MYGNAGSSEDIIFLRMMNMTGKINKQKPLKPSSVTS